MTYMAIRQVSMQTAFYLEEKINNYYVFELSHTIN